MEEYKLVPEKSGFQEFSPEDISLFFFVEALGISTLFTIDELNVLANGLFEMAQVLFVIASHRTLINDIIKKKQEEQEKQKEVAKKEKEEKTSTSQLQSAVEKLQETVKQMQQQINELKK